MKKIISAILGTMFATMLMSAMPALAEEKTGSGTTAPATETLAAPAPAAETPAGSSGGAASPAAPAKSADKLDPLSEHTFDVQKNLNLFGDQQDQSYFSDPKGHSPIVSFVLRIIDFAMKVIGSVAIILFIIAGFIMIVAQGNQQMIDKAKDVFKYALIGMAVAFFSYTIVLFLQSLFSKA